MDRRARRPPADHPASRHISRTKRYVRNYAHELEPDQVVEYVRSGPGAAAGWVKTVGTGSTGRSATWLRAGRTKPSRPQSPQHEEGAQVTAHCFREESLRQFAAAGTDGIEHACGLTPETIESFAAQRIAIVPTLVNIDTSRYRRRSAGRSSPVCRSRGRPARPAFQRRWRRHMTPAYPSMWAATRGHAPHGLAAQEGRCLTRAGMSTLEAIRRADLGRLARGWASRGSRRPPPTSSFSTPTRGGVEALQHPRQIVLRGALLPTG